MSELNRRDAIATGMATLLGAATVRDAEAGGFDLEPWQRQIVGDLYGWKRSDGTRKYRRAYIDMLGANRAQTHDDDPVWDEHWTLAAKIKSLRSIGTEPVPPPAPPDCGVSTGSGVAPPLGVLTFDDPPHMWRDQAENKGE